MLNPSSTNTIGGHHSKLRTTKPPTQLKNQNNIYNTKDSLSKIGHLRTGQVDSGFEALIGSNSSFQEDSTYLKNMAGSNYQSNKNGGGIGVGVGEVSFDSSSNQGFSQAGTPISYKVKSHLPIGTLKGGANGKNLNLMSASTVSGPKIVDRKPKKLVLQASSLQQ